MSDKTVALGAYVEAMIKGLVDHPDEVRVVVNAGGYSVVIELTVAASDVGQVIGKKGAHANALRVIIAAAAGKMQLRAVLEIVEPTRT